MPPEPRFQSPRTRQIVISAVMAAMFFIALGAAWALSGAKTVTLGDLTLNVPLLWRSDSVNLQSGSIAEARRWHSAPYQLVVARLNLPEAQANARTAAQAALAGLNEKWDVILPAHESTRRTAHGDLHELRLIGLWRNSRQGYDIASTLCLLGDGHTWYALLLSVVEPASPLSSGLEIPQELLQANTRLLGTLRWHGEALRLMDPSAPTVPDEGQGHFYFQPRKPF